MKNTHPALGSPTCVDGARERTKLCRLFIPNPCAFAATPVSSYSINGNHAYGLGSARRGERAKEPEKFLFVLQFHSNVIFLLLMEHARPTVEFNLCILTFFLCSLYDGRWGCSDNGKPTEIIDLYK